MSTAQLAPPVQIDDFYELRLYQMVPGRMPAFHDLMQGAALPLFARHGIGRPLGIWEGQTGPLSPLYAYIIRWRSLDARMAAWKSFYADPDWGSAVAQSYKGRPRVERSHIFILRPSAIWDRFSDEAPLGNTHVLSLHDTLNNDPNLVHQALAETDLPFLKAQGGKVMGVFSTWFGTRMNQAITLTAWDSADSWIAASRAHQTDAGILATRDAERRAHGRPLMRGTDVHILQPVAYGMPAPGLRAE